MAKICAITTIDSTLSSFVIDAMRLLRNNGHDIVLISSMSPDFLEQYQSEFRCINVPMSRGVNFRGMFKAIYILYSVFRKEKFDYIQYATPNASLYASIAAYIVKCPIRVYCQWGIRYVGFSGLKRSIFRLIEILTCKLSTDIRPASPKNMLFSVSEKHYPIEKAKIIGHGGTIGVDFSVFNKNFKDSYKQQIISEFPILQNKFIYGFVGRMDKDKGINELFESFLELHKRHKDTFLVIVGPEDKIEGIDECLYQEICKSGASLFTGYSRQVAKFLSCFDVLVHPSYREGFSMVIQQGMAMELPILTTNIPGPSEVIESEISGILAEPKDSSSLLKGMIRLYEDQELRLKLANKAYSRARKFFERSLMLSLTYKDRIELLNRK